MTQPKPAKMQHFAVEVSDMDRSIAWYREMLGFKLTERHPAGEHPNIPIELTFMRLGSVHHELVLTHNPAKTYRPRPARPEDDLDGPPMFHHFALESEDRAAWLALVEYVTAKGATVVRGPVLHSFAQSRGDGSWERTRRFTSLIPIAIG